MRGWRYDKFLHSSLTLFGCSGVRSCNVILSILTAIFAASGIQNLGRCIEIGNTRCSDFDIWNDLIESKLDRAKVCNLYFKCRSYDMHRDQEPCLKGIRLPTQ